MAKKCKIKLSENFYFPKTLFFFLRNFEVEKFAYIIYIENKIEYDCRFLHEQEDIAYSFLGINFVRWKLNQLIPKGEKNGTQKLYESC